MKDLENILDNKVSFQKTVFAPITHELKIKDILRGIKEERLYLIIEKLRKYLTDNNKDLYNQEKKFLPGVTFSATFNEKRRREKIKSYNSVIVLDIDKLNNEQLIKIKDILRDDKYVFSFWESPSKKGLKGLINISFDYVYENIDISHRIAFKKLVEYFQFNYEIDLDESGSDTTRLCFLSADKNLIIKKTISPFIITENDKEKYKPNIELSKGKTTTSKRKITKKDTLLNPIGKNLPSNRLTMKSIIKFLTKRNLSITNSYEKWYKVAFAIANSFTFDIGKEYFLKLCRLDNENHNEIESTNLLISAYETTNSKIKFNTIYYFTQEYGYKPKKLRDGSEGV